LNYYLGIEIKRNRNERKLLLNQTQYIRDLLKKFNMQYKEPVSTPIDTRIKLSKNQEPKTEKEKSKMEHVPFREAVGSLMYLAVSTRPDIATAISIVSRYLENPGPEHWNAVKRIMQYLKGTEDLTLELGGTTNLELTAYADADWAGCLDSRKSNTGYVILLGKSIISWKSKRQQTPAKSTTEAEYMSLAEVTAEILYLLPILEDMGYPMIKPVTIFEDNQGCIAISKNAINNARSKHIGIKYHFIRHYIERGDINVVYCNTNNMIADIMTKGLPKITFQKHRSNMNLKRKFTNE
jgi:hypothetical protein